MEKALKDGWKRVNNYYVKEFRFSNGVVLTEHKTEKELIQMYGE